MLDSDYRELMNRLGQMFGDERMEFREREVPLWVLIRLHRVKAEYLKVLEKEKGRTGRV